MPGSATVMPGSDPKMQASEPAVVVPNGPQPPPSPGSSPSIASPPKKGEGSKGEPKTTGSTPGVSATVPSTVVVVPVELPKEVEPPPPKEPERVPAPPSERKVSFTGSKGWTVRVAGGPTFSPAAVISLKPGIYNLTISPPSLPEYKDQETYTCSIEVYPSTGTGEQNVRLNDTVKVCR